MTPKERGRYNSFSASLTTKEIEWLRSHPKPQEALRNIIDTAIEQQENNDIKLLKKKEAELIDMYRLLTDAANNTTGKRQEELTKRARATWEKYEELTEQIRRAKYKYP